MPMGVCSYAIPYPKRELHTDLSVAELLGEEWSSYNENYCLGFKNSVSVTQLTGSQIYVLVQTLRWGCSLLHSGEIWLMCCIFWSEAMLESGACPKKAGTSPTQVIDLNSSEHLECQLVDLVLLGDSLLILNKRTLAASTELCCMLENSICLPCKI